MELTCNEIIRKGGTHEGFILRLFNAMETSDDTMFLALVTKKRHEWEEGAIGVITSAAPDHNSLMSKIKLELIRKSIIKNLTKKVKRSFCH